MISVDDWKAETYRLLVENKQKKIVDKGWTWDLVSKSTLEHIQYFCGNTEIPEELKARELLLLYGRMSISQMTWKQQGTQTMK